jgi:hypothetical protein
MQDQTKKDMATIKNSLRARIIQMKAGQTIPVSLATNKSITVYNYASFLGRELGRVYTTKFDKDARVILVTRQS